MSKFRIAVVLVAVLGCGVLHAEDAFKDGGPYRYVPFPRAKPGSTLYAHRNNYENVAICTDIFAHREFQKFLVADDKAGLLELILSGRLLVVPVGTEIKILDYDEDLAEQPSYEVRIMDSKHKGKSGWIIMNWAKARVPLELKPEFRKRKKR